MLKGPITLGKGLAITGSLGGLLSFFGFGGGLKDRERIFEVVSTVKNTDWNTGYVTPVFNSSWLGGGFENQTEYSYGYVARVVGHNFYESQDSTNSKRLKRDLSKAQEAEAELVLVEKVGNQSVAKTDKKHGLTPKKFLLVGSNKSTGEVEVTGLVSLVQYDHGGIKVKCQKTEGQGAIRDGSCDKIFFPTSNTETPPKFIKEELQKTDGSGVSIMQLTPKNKSLGVVFGSKEGKSEKGWSKTGYLYLGERSSGKVTKAKKAWTQLNNQGTGKNQKVALFFVVHDLIFSEGALKGEYKKKYDTYGTIYAGNDREKSDFQVTDKDIRYGNGKVIDIPLSSSRNYYIWDPSKTKIKNGEFVTDDGVKLPFKLGVNATWSSSLVK